MLINQLGLGVGQTGSNLRQYELNPQCPIHLHTEAYYEQPEVTKPKTIERRIVKTRGQLMIEGAVRRAKPPDGFGS